MVMPVTVRSPTVAMPTSARSMSISSTSRTSTVARPTRSCSSSRSVPIPVLKVMLSMIAGPGMNRLSPRMRPRTSRPPKPTVACRAAVIVLVTRSLV